MRSVLSLVKHDGTEGKRIAFVLVLAFFLMPVACEGRTPAAEKVLAYLKGLGNGSYMFGQMATWVHNENPDMDHGTNWLRKVYDHTGKMPRYGCVTYDFHDDPFPDSAWNDGVKKMWDRGLIVGVFTFYANPSGRSWNDPVDIDPIFAPGDNPTKRNFYNQMDRMAANLRWLKDRGIPVVYTPFVESDDRNKWHAKEGPENIIKLYCLDVVNKLETSYPELAGFVFWSDDGHYNVIGNNNGPELMAHPRIVTLETK